jgi:DNA ligase (NAD+)
MNYIQQRNLLFLGEDSVDRLMAIDGPLQTIPDLYRLTAADLERACGGPAMATKVASGIAKTRQAALHELLGAVGIPGLGATEARKIVSSLNIRDADSMLEILCRQPHEIEGIAGFGSLKAQKIQRGAILRESMVRDLLQFVTVTMPAAGPLTGMHFAATGASERPREEIRAILEAAGAEFHSSVTNAVTHLVIADPRSQSTKARAAREKGVQLVSEEEAIRMAQG